MPSAKQTARRLYGKNAAYTKAVNKALRGGASQYRAHQAGIKAMRNAGGRGAVGVGTGGG